jgi:hypothetical protein
MWDAAALALVVGGAAVYLEASKGMQGLLGPQPRVPSVGSPHVERWLHFRSLSNLGVGLVTAGVLVGVMTYFRARRDAAAISAAPAVAPDLLPNVPQE